MGDPRVQERDNPLVRRLNAVAQENERLGTALGGGARPPRAPIGPVQGGTSTVLPPPAVPLTPEEALGDALPPAEAEELERRWATDPSNPANKVTPITPQVPSPVAARADMGQGNSTPTYVEMVEALPITDEQKQTVRAWVFAGAAQQIMAETARRLDAMQIAFGLAPKKEENKEAQGERGEQAQVEGTKPRRRSAARTAVARRRKKPSVQGGTPS